MNVITDYAQQAIINKDFKFHFVSYELSNHFVNVIKFFPAFRVPKTTSKIERKKLNLF